MSIYIDAKPYHVAHVVPDLDAAVDRLLASGIGPAHFIRGTRMSARYRGELIHVHVSAAFVVIAGQLTELVSQDDDTRSTFTDFLVRHPSGALHHVAYYSDDFDATVSLSYVLQSRNVPDVDDILRLKQLLLHRWDQVCSPRHHPCGRGRTACVPCQQR